MPLFSKRDDIAERVDDLKAEFESKLANLNAKLGAHPQDEESSLKEIETILEATHACINRIGSFRRVINGQLQCPESFIRNGVRASLHSIRIEGLPPGEDAFGCDHCESQYVVGTGRAG